MNRIRCLVVDDEPLARTLLNGYIRQDPELEIIGEAEDAEEALQMIERSQPDLLFLDVQMPEVNGFDLLRLVEAAEQPEPATIFVTAFDQYAIKAFDASAVDYLLKPVDEERFRKAVRAAKKRLSAEKQTSANRIWTQFASGQTQRIPIRSKGGRISFVRAHDIQWIEADGNYLHLHLANEQHLVRETMASFQDRLAGLPFARIHRSTIVNLEFVREIDPWYTGEYIVRLQNGKELTLSRTYRDQVLELTKRPRV